MTMRARWKPVRIALAAAMAALLSGCSSKDIPLLNPVGEVAKHQYDLFLISVLVMGAIVVPIMVLTPYFVWRYRAGAAEDRYDPEFVDDNKIEKFTLFVPLFTIAILGALTWVYTHRLDPYEPRGEAHEKPYEIQAISLNYKWLFVYPEENIATINEMVAPSGRPVTVRLTSDPMMTAIFIPGLISQIYAMPGMETRANFLADRKAVLQGSNAMYSGPGFEHQRFKARIVSPENFEAWVSTVKSGGGKAKAKPVLNASEYAALLPNSTDNPVTYYAAVEPGMFQRIVQKYMPEYTMKPLPSRAEYDGGLDFRKLTHDGHGRNAAQHGDAGHALQGEEGEVADYEAQPATKNPETKNPATKGQASSANPTQPKQGDK